MTTPCQKRSCQNREIEIDKYYRPIFLLLGDLQKEIDTTDSKIIPDCKELSKEFEYVDIEPGTAAAVFKKNYNKINKQHRAYKVILSRIKQHEDEYEKNKPAIIDEPKTIELKFAANCSKCTALKSGQADLKQEMAKMEEEKNKLQTELDKFRQESDSKIKSFENERLEWQTEFEKNKKESAEKIKEIEGLKENITRQFKALEEISRERNQYKEDLELRSATLDQVKLKLDKEGLQTERLNRQLVDLKTSDQEVQKLKKFKESYEKSKVPDDIFRKHREMFPDIKL